MSVLPNVFSGIFRYLQNNYPSFVSGFQIIQQETWAHKISLQKAACDMSIHDDVQLQTAYPKSCVILCDKGYGCAAEFICESYPTKIGRHLSFTRTGGIQWSSLVWSYHCWRLIWSDAFNFVLLPHKYCWNHEKFSKFSTIQAKRYGVLKVRNILYIQKNSAYIVKAAVPRAQFPEKSRSWKPEDFHCK